MKLRSEAYLQAAEWAHQQAESALSPQEKNLFVEIERSFRRLAEIYEWQSAYGLNQRQYERPFAFCDLFRG